MLTINKSKILVTGAAGFIGAHLIIDLVKSYNDISVIGVDNLNDYYDVSLKEYRLELIDKEVNTSANNWSFVKGDISDSSFVKSIFDCYQPDIVINLAAQAGVRYSISNPDSYINSNILGFYNILEACRHSYDGHINEVKHLVYASSSSVYGGNSKIPFSTLDKVDSPVSLYAATKKSNELLAHCYSKLYCIPTTGLRFFTVYGPAGRPDMAYFGFTNKFLAGKSIDIYNYGNCSRDFTYIDDIVQGIERVIAEPPIQELGKDGLPIPPYSIYNIGNGSPENLLEFIDILQQELIRVGLLPQDYDFESHKNLLPMQPGDVAVTYADMNDFKKKFGYTPHTSLRDGLRKFAEWYKEFYFDK